MSFFRTMALLTVLTALMLGTGYLLGGVGGTIIALVLALGINFISYWYSDKIVLGMYGAKPSSDARLNRIVKKLASDAEIPKPKVYIVKMEAPNAFATGRDPGNAAVAATTGILKVLNDEEIEGVLAHELAHVKNRDTLISTMAAIMAGAISFLANMAWWSMFGNRDRGTVYLLPLLILAPIAAAIVRLAINRGREFGADYTGALMSGKPLALASALEKIHSSARTSPMRGNSATSHLFIVNPFSGGLAGMFSTHPPVEERVKRLREMKV